MANADCYAYLNTSGKDKSQENKIIQQLPIVENEETGQTRLGTIPWPLPLRIANSHHYPCYYLHDSNYIEVDCILHFQMFTVELK